MTMQSRSLSRRAAIGTIAAAAVTPAVAGALPASPDPIFAAIDAREATLVAVRKENKRLDLLREGKLSAQALADSHRAEDANTELDLEAIDILLATEPTTLAGVCALLGYIETKHAAGDEILDDERSLKLIASLRTSLSRIAA